MTIAHSAMVVTQSRFIRWV